MITLEMSKQNWNGLLQVDHAKVEIHTEICDSGEKTQTMDHLLKCPMLHQECATEDLI